MVESSTAPLFVARCYTDYMSTVISQREFRNNSADIMRRLQAGESFTVTTNGKVVGSLTPATQPMGLPITRPATQHGFAGFPLHSASETSLAAILDDVRGDRL